LQGFAAHISEHHALDVDDDTQISVQLADGRAEAAGRHLCVRQSADARLTGRLPFGRQTVGQPVGLTGWRTRSRWMSSGMAARRAEAVPADLLVAHMRVLVNNACMVSFGGGGGGAAALSSPGGILILIVVIAVVGLVWWLFNH
jgi:hypothetical protein